METVLDLPSPHRDQNERAYYHPLGRALAPFSTRSACYCRLLAAMCVGIDDPYMGGEREGHFNGALMRSTSPPLSPPCKPARTASRCSCVSPSIFSPQ